MVEGSSNILTILIALPILGGIASVLLGRMGRGVVFATGLIFSLIELVIAAMLFGRYDIALAGMQFAVKVPWISQLGISYHVGADGISAVLILLTALMTPLAIAASWASIKEGMRGFIFCMLLLESAIVGAFCAMDLFLFYLFWEAMLIPLYLLIGIWGSANRIYAAVKFFLFTMAGSLLMLVAIISLALLHYKTTGVASFDLFDLKQIGIPLGTQRLFMWAFFLAFAVKVPLFPLHTWLPDAHVEAPTAGSVILAALTLKVGAYGFIRFLFPLFPEAVMSGIGVVSVLAMIGVVYGALAAMAQPDLKKLVAYSSISHLAMVIVGFYAFNREALAGATLQMVNHGLATGALFIMVGSIYERTHTRKLADLGGLWNIVPKLSGYLLFFALASLGLPGLASFVGEVLIIVGSWKANHLWAFVVGIGVLLSAVYLLVMVKRVVFSKRGVASTEDLKDLGIREKLVLGVLAILIIFLGFYPQPILVRIEKPLNELLSEMPDTGHGIATEEVLRSSSLATADMVINDVSGEMTGVSE
jgi:NADH-quinone oxidoreductase subunit M